MKATRTLAITIFGIAALGLAAWFGWAAFGPDGTEGAGREFTYRNVSLTLPAEGSDLHARADYAEPGSAEKPGGGPVVVVTDESEARSGYMVIDANTGDVLLDAIGGVLRDEADDVLASIREPEGDAAIWPLADVEAPRGREVSFGNITYVEPDPRSGIFILRAQGFGTGGSSAGLFIHNGASRMLVDGGTGKMDMSLVLANDSEVFERLAATIRVDRTQ